MALQIRVSVPEFSSGVNFTDPVILQYADNIILTKTVNSSEEGISFSISISDPKINYVTYTRWWECWDTVTNQRLNYGPITSITNRTGEVRQVSGPGRSYILSEYHKSIQTFYYPIDKFFDNLRFENVAAAPSTRTLIDTTEKNDYYGLSKRTKDNAIDEQTGYIAIGRDTPQRGTIKTTNFWAGTGKSDWLTIDLGEPYKISKAQVLLPWWGGVTINNNRTYDWQLRYSDDNATFSTIYTTGTDNRHVTNPQEYGVSLWMGETGYEEDYHDVANDPVEARYWKLNIFGTHAWYNSEGAFGTESSEDNWNWECNHDHTFKLSGGGTIEKDPPTSSPYVIPKKEIGPDNDCYASAVEIQLLRKIIGRDYISNLFYAQIENTNRQITYHHHPAASEMITTDTSTIRKFEPGSTFRNVSISWSGNTGTVNIKDEFNNIIKSSTLASTNPPDAIAVECPAYSRVIQIEGVANSQVETCDAWLAKLDPFSYGGSYAYTEIQDDYFVLRFRGKTLRWYSTVPSGKTAAQVKIELRTQAVDGTWSAWSTLVASKTMPTNIRGELVYEITEESGLLTDNTTYEFRGTLLNTGYLSVDAFTGYWSASYTEYNENDARFGFRNPAFINQKFDASYSNGSIYEYNTYASPIQSIMFTGDRVTVTSLKTNTAGTVKIGIVKFDPTVGYGQPDAVVDIPNSNDGYRQSIDLDVAANITIPQAVIFDSDDFWGSPGMPWDTYLVGVYSESQDGKVYVDGMGVHERQGLSVKFLDTSYLDILKSTTQAMVTEWDITENGLVVRPRIGSDKWYVFKEGTNTVINIQEVQDADYIASRLMITGGEIEGIPLSAVVEDKVNKSIFGRTIQKSFDLRSVLDWFTLVALGRVELRKRRSPQRRITITHTGDIPVDLQHGDSVIIKTRSFEKRVRILTIRRSQSRGSGTTYDMEATEWPQIA